MRTRRVEETTGSRAAVPAPPTGSGPDEHRHAEEEVDDPLADDVSQQITRMWAAEDGDTVTGIMRAGFQPGERSQSLHVAFCPPMVRRPDVTVAQLSGSRARIKAGDVQTFGVRLDLRLAAASDEMQSVLIHFEARCGKPEAAGLGEITPQ